MRVRGFTGFGGVRLDGTISGPGPLVIRGKLTIETFLFDISWNETFTIGSGPGDMAQRPGDLLPIIKGEIDVAGNVRAASIHDAAVVLSPRRTRPGTAAVPATGALQWSQKRAPLGFPIDRVDGLPLETRKGVRVTTLGAPVLNGSPREVIAAPPLRSSSTGRPSTFSTAASCWTAVRRSSASL